jgi:hypothetical protein
MRPLIINADIRSAIRSLRERAAARPITLEQGRKLAIQPKDEFHIKHDERNGERPASEFLNLPFGYRIAYSVEQQPIGFCGHLSISVDRPGRVPHPAAVEMLAAEFGMTLQHAHMWLEDFKPDHAAVNVVQLLSAPTPETEQ